MIEFKYAILVIAFLVAQIALNAKTEASINRITATSVFAHQGSEEMTVANYKSPNLEQIPIVVK